MSIILTEEQLNDEYDNISLPELLYNDFTNIKIYIVYTSSIYTLIDNGMIDNILTSILTINSNYYKAKTKYNLLQYNLKCYIKKPIELPKEEPKEELTEELIIEL